jgi:hypothetical protein
MSSFKLNGYRTWKRKVKRICQASLGTGKRDGDWTPRPRETLTWDWTPQPGETWSGDWTPPSWPHPRADSRSSRRSRPRTLLSSPCSVKGNSSSDTRHGFTKIAYRNTPLVRQLAILPFFWRYLFISGMKVTDKFQKINCLLMICFTSVVGPGCLSRIRHVTFD